MDIFDIKTCLMSLLIKLIVKRPEIMESKLFLKAMLVFPAKISRSYDAKTARMGKDYEAVFEKGLTRIIKRPGKILDLCTGTGFAAFAVSARFPDAEVEAIDQSNEMLRIAKKKSQDKDIDAIKFKEGNAASLEFDDNIFDLIVTSNAPVYLSEASRVLKPNGLLLLSYSFGGSGFKKARNGIYDYFKKNGLILLEIENVRNGAYIIGRKPN